MRDMKIRERGTMEHQNNLHSKKYCKQRRGEFSLWYAWTSEVAHPNMFAFPGHLQRATADTEAEIERTNQGLVIRRAKHERQA